MRMAGLTMVPSVFACSCALQLYFLFLGYAIFSSSNGIRMFQIQSNYGSNSIVRV